MLFFSFGQICFKIDTMSFAWIKKPFDPKPNHFSHGSVFSLNDYCKWKQLHLRCFSSYRNHYSTYWSVYRKVLFQTVQDNVVIDDIHPFFNQNVNNRLKCYAICQRTPDKCLFVEVSQLQTDVWSCKLFEFASGNTKDHLKRTLPGTSTTVSAPTLKRDF